NKKRLDGGKRLTLTESICKKSSNNNIEHFSDNQLSRKVNQMTRAATRSRRSSITLEENRNYFNGNTQNLILSENPIINYQASDQTSTVPLANNYEQLPETKIYSQSSKQEHLISSSQST
ncbi:44700_t:CDS:1, partial [Gigaspora margarita]